MIVVLGVLSGIVLFGVGRFRSDANAAACQADVSAVNAYQAVTGNYPRALPDLTVGQYLMSAPAGWNATVSQSGSRMRAQAPDWSTTLAPGASWAIGFIAGGPFSPPPSAVALNGVSCSRPCHPSGRMRSGSAAAAGCRSYGESLRLTVGNGGRGGLVSVR